MECFFFRQAANLEGVAAKTGGKQYFASDDRADEALQQVATDYATIGCDDEEAAVVVRRFIHYFASSY